mgnify:CR=1 FL=1
MVPQEPPLPKRENAHAILFSHNTNLQIDQLPAIHINNTDVKHEQNTDFLGITISHNLSWDKHISKLNKSYRMDCKD